MILAGGDTLGWKRFTQKRIYSDMAFTRRIAMEDLMRS